MMTKESLNKLRAKLPKGYAKTLHSRTGLTESTIYKTLVGGFKNPNIDIINAAIKLAQEATIQTDDMEQQINSL